MHLCFRSAERCSPSLAVIMRPASNGWYACGTSRIVAAAASLSVTSFSSRLPKRQCVERHLEGGGQVHHRRDLPDALSICASSGCLAEGLNGHGEQSLDAIAKEGR